MTLRGVAWCGVGVVLGHDDLMAYCGVACHGLECHGVAWRCVLVPHLGTISLVPTLGAISLVPPLAIMPLLPRTIALGPYTLVAIPLVPRHLGVVTLVPRLVAELRRDLFFVGWK